jgi:hypothetical protein
MQIKNILYQGKIELLFQDFKHRYTVGGKDVPSVTHILDVISKPQLVNWATRVTVEFMREAIQPGVAYDEIQLHSLFENASKAPYQKKKDAGSFGTLVHAWVEQYIHGENPPIPVNEEMKKSVSQFLDWVRRDNVKFLASEQVIYSRKYNYTGTFDFICKIDGKLYMGDTKTSKGIYTSYMNQVAAYRHARQEEFPKEKYEGQIIIRVGKDGEFEKAIMRGDEIYNKLFTTFLAAKNLYEGLKELDAYEPER